MAKKRPSVEVPLGDFFCNGWCERCNVSSLPMCGQPGRRLQLLLGDAVPQACPHHHREPARRMRSGASIYQINYTLTEVPAGPRLLPRPVAAQQPAALCRGAYAAGWRARPGAVRRHLPGLGRATTTAGGARARSSSTWTATASSRPSAAPAPRITSAAPGTSSIPTGPVRRLFHPFPGPAAGDQAGWAVRQPAALRHVPLARHGPHPLPAGPARDHPGAGLAQRSRAARYLPLQDDIASTAFWYQAEPHAALGREPHRSGCGSDD